VDYGVTLNPHAQSRLNVGIAQDHMTLENAIKLIKAAVQIVEENISNRIDLVQSIKWHMQRQQRGKELYLKKRIGCVSQLYAI
jgi:hypothetical protein